MSGEAEGVGLRKRLQQYDSLVEHGNLIVKGLYSKVKDHVCMSFVLI